MPFADINGHHLYFADTGGDGPAVLFSHGFGLSHAMWDAQVAALAPAHRCIVWDERGHGMSDCHGTYTFWDLADDAVALLDHLGIERATLVGLSQGGFLSMRCALRHPTRVAGLVLVDTKAALDDAETQAGYRAWGDAWTTLGPTDDLAAQMAALQFGSGYEANTWIATWRSRPPMSTRDQWTSVVDGRDDVSGRLGEVRCPVVVLVGEHDGAFPPAAAAELAASFDPPARLVTIPGAHHAPPVTHPGVVTDEIRRFMERLAM